MGNYASCALTNPKQAKIARVILPDGETKEFNQPTTTKAAELMLEIPNHFVVNSRSLQLGRRFLPLNADEDLEMGNAYVMFPMHRVNSVVSASDLGTVYLATKRGAGSKVRVVPADSSSVGPAARVLEGIHDLSSQEVQCRRSVCRSRKPSLETIAEEACCS